MAFTTSPGDRPGRVAERCFVVGIAGLPLWWLLGVAALVPLLLAVPLYRDLRTRRRVSLPPQFGWWLLFLVWVLLGVATLWAAAPGAVDDGGAGRLLVFAYRLGWYVSCTVLLVWLGNTSKERLPDRTVHRVLASVFVVTVAGGLLGLLSPDLSFTTLAERVLPGGLRSNGFVSTLVSAETADVQRVLGDDQPRPKAPFAYTNTWGSVVSLSLVFFAASVAAARPRLRWLAAPVLAVAAVPIVLSLNRGLWLALGAGAVGLLVLLACRRHHTALAGLSAVVILGGVTLTTTSLGETVSERLDHPHSNDRRSQLLVATVDSVTRGSPVVGYGSTRDVEGTFASIAGGATSACPACGVPPLGTQGQLWLVLFSQGWIGTLFFLSFFVLALRRTWRCRTTNQTVATFVLGIFLLQLTVYDTLGLPMLIVMTAVGLAWREEQSRSPLRRPSGRDLAVVGVVALLGGTAGAIGASAGGDRHLVSTVTVGLTPTPTYLDVGDIAREAESETMVGASDPATVDTEAALLRSEPALERAGRRVDMTPADLRSDIRVAAPPLSTVLEVSVTTRADQDPRAAALTVSEEYLAERGRVLEGRRTDLVARLGERLAAIDPTDPAWAQPRAYLRAAIDHLTTHRPEVGRVIRVGPARSVGTAYDVPAATGLALGGLVALAALRLRSATAPRRRRP